MDDYGNEITHQQIESIAERAAERAVERLTDEWVPRDVHHDDHQWIQTKRSSEEVFKESRRRVIEKIVGGAGTVGLLGLFGWVGHAMLTTMIDYIDKVVP